MSEHTQDAARRDAAARAVRPPAIALLVTAALGVLSAVGSLLYSRFVYELASKDETLDAQGLRAVELMFGPVSYAVHGFALVAAALALAGAVSMLNVKSRGLALTGCVAAMLMLSACCCVAGVPVGIWGLVVLSRPEVRAAFGRGA